MNDMSEERMTDELIEHVRAVMHFESGEAPLVLQHFDAICAQAKQVNATERTVAELRAQVAAFERQVTDDATAVLIEVLGEWVNGRRVADGISQTVLRRAQAVIEGPMPPEVANELQRAHPDSAAGRAVGPPSFGVAQAFERAGETIPEEPPSCVAWSSWMEYARTLKAALLLERKENEGLKDKPSYKMFFSLAETLKRATVAEAEVEEVRAYVDRQHALNLANVAAAEAESAGLREALREVRAFAIEAHAAWDADKEMRVGKMLMALSGMLPGYRPDTDRIDALLAPRREKEHESDI